MVTDFPTAVLDSSFTTVMAWVLYRALKTGTLQVIRGRKSSRATRADEPIVYWTFVLVNGLIFISFAASAAYAWGFAVPI